MAGVLERAGVPFASYDMATPRGVASLLVAMLIVGFCVWLAARAVVRKPDFYQAMTAGMVGLVCAQLAYVLTAGQVDLIGFALGLVAFSLVTAAIYRAKAGQGFVIGAVAWVFWILATILLGYVQQHWH